MNINEKNEQKNIYNFENAIEILKNNKKKKFVESIDTSITLELFPKKKDINIKGYSCLPNNIKKIYKIAVFTTNASELDIKKDDIILFDDKTIKTLTKKNINFNILLTDTKSITKLGNINKILNSKKLMPDIQYHTITSNFKESIEKIKNNYIQYKNNKTNTINCKIGNIDLETKNIKENLETLISDIKKNKPKNCKNIKIKHIYLSSTMSKSIKININSLNL